MKLAIIGGGGLGANLAILATEQGHEVLVVDNDTADEKFFNRFAFFTGHRKFMEGLPKVETIEQVSVDRGHPVATIFATVDKDFDYDKLKGYYCVIAVDTAGAREIIEAKLKVLGGFEYVHVGCNLNSVSIFKSMINVVATDPSADAQTSYDAVPDLWTYLVAATKFLQWLTKIEVRILIDENTKDLWSQ
jgi:D-arabinose 1-dehydrogenase-like Zn-dependent alcohol dehydrogenase